MLKEFLPMSLSVPRAASVSLILVAALFAFASPAGAQDDEATCFGMTAAEAEAQGFRVQLGTDGVDVLTGGNTSRDFMIGFDGDDFLSGAGADDIICGGDGDDTISTGDGDDMVDGGFGEDDITLGAGDDIAEGGGDDDRLVGGSGNDRIRGNAGADRISGETGNDVLLGNLGQDVIFGGEGNDRIRGHRSRDSLAGGPGDDEIFGGKAEDTISGDDGNDRISGGRGNDTIDGDEGIDTLIGSHGDADRCDISDDDGYRTCEVDFDGDIITGERDTPEIPGAEEPAPAPEPEPTPEPTPDPEPADPAPPTGAPVPASQAPQGVNEFGWPLLTDVGLEAMLFCESTNNHAINTGNGFFGGVQWLPATWNAAADRAGFPQYVGVLPHLVPADVQDDVTKVWWELTRPNTQWPTCHKRALEAMNVLAP